MTRAPLVVQLLFVVLILVLAWQSLENLWYVSHTATADCARVVDTSASRRGLRIPDEPGHEH